MGHLGPDSLPWVRVWGPLRHSWTGVPQAPEPRTEEERASPSHRLLTHSSDLPSPASPVSQLLPPCAGLSGHPPLAHVPDTQAQVLPGSGAWPGACHRPTVPTASRSHPTGLEPRAAQGPSSPSPPTHRSLLPGPLALPTHQWEPEPTGIPSRRGTWHWQPLSRAPRGLLTPSPSCPLSPGHPRAGGSPYSLQGLSPPRSWPASPWQTTGPTEWPGPRLCIPSGGPERKPLQMEDR